MLPEKRLITFIRKGVGKKQAGKPSSWSRLSRASLLERFWEVLQLVCDSCDNAGKFSGLHSLMEIEPSSSSSTTAASSSSSSSGCEPLPSDGDRRTNHDRPLSCRRSLTAAQVKALSRDYQRAKQCVIEQKFNNWVRKGAHKDVSTN